MLGVSTTLPQPDDQNRPGDFEPSLADGPQEIDGELMGLLQVVDTEQPFLAEQDTLVTAPVLPKAQEAPVAAVVPTPTSTDKSPSSWVLVGPALLSGAAVAALLLALGATLAALFLQQGVNSSPAMDSAFLVEPPREPVVEVASPVDPAPVEAAPVETAPPARVPAPTARVPASAPPVAAPPQVDSDAPAAPAPAPAKVAPVEAAVAAPAPASELSPSADAAPVAAAPAPERAAAPVAEPVPTEAPTPDAEVKPVPAREPEGYMGLPSDL